MIRTQLQQWFDWMDHILDIHRSHFVLREPTPEQLRQHKIALRTSIRYCHAINTLIGDPEFNEPELVSRLNIRSRQLQDAYDAFYDPHLSGVKADLILQQVFPE